MDAFANLSVGQKVIIDLGEELLLGTLCLIDMEFDRIEMQNVQDLLSNIYFQGVQKLMGRQIRSVKLIDETDKDGAKSVSEPLQSDESKQDADDVNRTDSTDTTEPVQINASILEKIGKHLSLLKLIYQMDQRFHAALAEIRAHTTVGLLLVPFELGRFQQISIMVISTEHAVFVFDVQAMGQMLFHVFRDILEAEQPRKVVHMRHRINDYLLQNHNINLSGYFDTAIAYALANGNRKPTSLVDAITETLRLPTSYFAVFDEAEPNQAPDNHNVFNRPINKSLLSSIAKQAICQLHLYDHLLHKKLLKDFYERQTKFAMCFPEKTDDHAELMTKLKKNSDMGYRDLDVGKLKIADDPEEHDFQQPQ